MAPDAIIPRFVGVPCFIDQDETWRRNLGQAYLDQPCGRIRYFSPVRFAL